MIDGKVVSGRPTGETCAVDSLGLISLTPIAYKQDDRFRSELRECLSGGRVVLRKPPNDSGKTPVMYDKWIVQGMYAEI